MKWLSNRYALPLVIFVIVVTVALQLAWLSQLFDAQKVQVRRDLEHLTGISAAMSTYLSEVPGHENSKNFHDFFLSPEWLQFRQAYSNMRFNNLGSMFNADIKGDSTIVDISLRIFNGSTPQKHHRKVIRFDNGVPLSQAKISDHIDQLRMDSILKKQLDALNFPLNYFHVIYNYDDKQLGDHPANIIGKADFSSQQYAYNLKFLNMYQLVVPSVTGLIFYRMRYYLVSSVFMLGLTIIVFIFMLTLMRNQRLYTKARISFTSNMTHELKTPVATVALAIESIKENYMRNDLNTIKSYLEISQSELKRLNLMIDKVLNLEQLDNGRQPTRLETFDIQSGIGEVISSMRLQIENAGATVNWQHADIPCFVKGVPGHLTNVLYNLLENALKHGGKGVIVTITCFIKNDNAIISFRDTGPGILSQYQNQVFDRYFRVPAGDNDIHNVKGTGLGLNYVKQVIESYGGHIKLESKPGQGCNFSMYLPAVS